MSLHPQPRPTPKHLELRRSSSPITNFDFDMFPELGSSTTFPPPKKKPTLDEIARCSHIVRFMAYKYDITGLVSLSGSEGVVLIQWFGRGTCSIGVMLEHIIDRPNLPQNWGRTPPFHPCCLQFRLSKPFPDQNDAFEIPTASLSNDQTQVSKKHIWWTRCRILISRLGGFPRVVEGHPCHKRVWLYVWVAMYSCTV